MKNNDKVLITGASGFIGAHCTLELLNAGYDVRASVRTTQRVKQLSALLEQHKPDAQLEIVVATLEDHHGWAEAVARCRYVLHIASPLPVEQPRDPQDLIRPARDGVLRVLKAARAAGVQRVVMTSSQAAVAGSSVEQQGYVYSEKDWTDLADPTLSPYNQSKTLAERAAWEYVEEVGDIELVSVNPGLVCGSILEPKVNTSLEFIKRMMDGSLPLIPPLGYEIVDVRDVAVLHRLAMTHLNAAGWRFMASAEFMWLHQMAEILREHLGEDARRVPGRRAPAWLMRLLALFDPSIRSILPDLNQYRPVDHSTSTRVLGWHPRPAQDAILATAHSLLAYDLV